MGMKGSGDATIGANYASTLIHDVKTSYEADYEEEHHLSCTAPPEGGVGFWQWKTKTNDGKSTVLSKHTLCRYGI